MQTLTPIPGTGLRLPLYLTQVPAGFPSPADDYVETSLDIERLLVRRPAATFFVRTRGNSMSPYIENGDLLVVDRSVPARDGHVVIATLDGELTVKQLFKRGGVLSLLPTNKDYAAIDVTLAQEFRIWGVVTYIVRAACTPS